MLEALYNAIRKDAKPVVVDVNGKKYGAVLAKKKELG